MRLTRRSFPGAAALGGVGLAGAGSTSFFADVASPSLGYNGRPWRQRFRARAVGHQPLVIPGAPHPRRYRHSCQVRAITVTSTTVSAMSHADPVRV